jgi:hypothetical protein
MRQPSTGKLLVHVVNYTGQRNTRYADPVPTHGLRLGVRTGVSATAHALVAGKTLTGRRRNGDGDHVWFDLPPVEAFEAVQLTIA